LFQDVQQQQQTHNVVITSQCNLPYFRKAASSNPQECSFHTALLLHVNWQILIRQIPCC